ncbi:MAG: TetR/AcrR family transcriptional regulator [Solirubrobacteraceae bacterium]|nr:TetR/AcrR family transcriptional regulator [Solirubrobacteraceae bacterium]
MPRPTKIAPERGDARARLLEAATDLIRIHGFSATTVDDICRRAQTTKGAFFHHFATKDAIGVAAADNWQRTTTAFFEAASYHDPADPLDRVLGYVEFRRSIIAGAIPEFTCLVGTMVGEVHHDRPEIRDACAASIFGHAATLEADIAAAMTARGVDGGWSAAGLARHIQGVIQGAFVLAKAADDPDMARESLDHLDRYLVLLLRPAAGSAA